MRAKEIIAQELVFETQVVSPKDIRDYLVTRAVINQDRISGGYFQSKIANGFKIRIHESVEAEILPFIERIKASDYVRKIKVGDMFSVLEFELVYSWKEIYVSGVIEPQKVADIKIHSSGKINYIQFENGDRYPRQTPAICNGKPVTYAIYYQSANQAQQDLSMLSLAVPDSWTLEIDDSITPMKEDAQANGIIVESSATNLIIVDVQPEYAEWCENIVPSIRQMIERSNGKIVIMFNGEEVGSNDTVDSVFEYFVDDEDYDFYNENQPQSRLVDNLQSAKFIEKGYGYFRKWMDPPTEMSDAAIIRTIRAMYQHRINDSRQFENLGINIADVAGQEWSDHVDNPKINIYLPKISIAFLKQHSPFYLMGGGRHECLREIELICNAFNIRYRRVNDLIY